jgi:uncharacterized lipoprotein YmbA
MRGENMRRFRHIKIIDVVLVTLFVSIGCTSTAPSRFYTLNSLSMTEPLKNSSPPKFSMALGPIDIPDYLDRQQIVIRTSQNELTLSEFDRWAGSLSENVARVLSENLSVLMAPDQISIVPWAWGVAYDYRVSVSIVKFDIMPEGNILLNADWALTTRNGTKLGIKRESITEPVQGHTYQARVSSMSGALAILGRHMASEIESVLRKPLSKKAK